MAVVTGNSYLFMYSKVDGGRERRGWGGRGGSDVAKKKNMWSNQMFCSEELKEQTVDGSLKNKFN